MKIARSISALTLLVCVGVSVHAEETLRARKLPMATMRELATIQLPPRLKREVRHEEKRRFGAHTTNGRIASNESAVLPRLTTQATIAAPPIAHGFASTYSDEIGPPDASGAVSKTHVVGASNIGLVVHSRSGARLLEVALSQFWNGGNDDLEFYDPRVTYDAAADRWVAVSIRDERAMMIGVSASGDPTGTWIRYEIPIADCDFSRLALTRDTIIATTVEWASGRGKVVSVTKSDIYAGTNPLPIRSYTMPSDVTPVSAPDSPIEYIVYSGDSDLTIGRLDRPGQTKVIDAGFSWVWPWGSSAPQAESSTELDIGFGDATVAVFRGGSIYTVHRIGTSTRTTDDNALLWWKADPEGVKAPEIGIIDSPKDVTYAYPSLAVNRDGGMVISFCTLSKTTFPSASFVYRDPSGRISAPAVVRSGTSRVVGFDRWGDYTTVVVDPSNERDFWIGQIYATRLSWETWWTNVKIGAGRARAVRH